MTQKKKNSSTFQGGFVRTQRTGLLNPDEIERLAEKLVTLYQDDIEQRFSNELLQFVDYSNEFLDGAENTIYI